MPPLVGVFYLYWLISTPRWRARSSNQAISSFGGETKSSARFRTSRMASEGHADAKSASYATLLNDLIDTINLFNGIYLTALICADTAQGALIRIDLCIVAGVDNLGSRNSQPVDPFQYPAAAPAAITYKIVAALNVPGEVNQAFLLRLLKHFIGLLFGDGVTHLAVK